jgi:hypothetical protein
MNENYYNEISRRCPSTDLMLGPIGGWNSSTWSLYLSKYKWNLTTVPVDRPHAVTQSPGTNKTIGVRNFRLPRNSMNFSWIGWLRCWTTVVSRLASEPLVSNRTFDWNLPASQAQWSGDSTTTCNKKQYRVPTTSIGYAIISTTIGWAGLMFFKIFFEKFQRAFAGQD